MLATEREYTPWRLVPKNDGNGNELSSPPKSIVSDTPFVAVQAQSGQQRQPSLIPLFDKGSRGTQFVAAERREEKQRSLQEVYK
jgi:hypothetical protein